MLIFIKLIQHPYGYTYMLFFLHFNINLLFWYTSCWVLLDDEFYKYYEIQVFIPFLLRSSVSIVDI